MVFIRRWKSSLSFAQAMAMADSDSIPMQGHGWSFGNPPKQREEPKSYGQSHGIGLGFHESKGLSEQDLGYIQIADCFCCSFQDYVLECFPIED